MLRYLILLAPALLLSLHLQAQTCASPFASGTITIVETCNPTGAYTYGMTVTATSDSALQFVGLWLEQQPVSADVDCNTQTFTIPQQFLLTDYDVRGQGSIVPPNIQIVYGVHSTVTNNLVDSCILTYPMVVVAAVSDPKQQQLEVYPNPATDQAHLKLKAAGTDCSYRLVDLQGRTVAEGILDSQLEAQIDLQALTRGIYRVVVQKDDGQLATKVLVVQ